jgi:hypothetical protein
MTSLKKTMITSSNQIDSEPGQVIDESNAVDGKFALSDMDVAAQYATKLGGQDAYTKQEARWLLWKIDLRIIPVLFFNVSLPAVDKVTTCKFVPFIEKP